jgi:hypothetical protein
MSHDGTGGRPGDSVPGLCHVQLTRRVTTGPILGAFSQVTGLVDTR